MSIPTVILIAHDEFRPHDDIERYGPEVAARVEAIGGDVLAIEVIPLVGELFEDRMAHYIEGEVGLLLTVGGSGIAPDDVVPELTSIMVERRVPGLEELFRRALVGDHPEGALERGACGIVGETLVVNLPRELFLIEALLASLSPILPTILARLQGREQPYPDDLTGDDED